MTEASKGTVLIMCIHTLTKINWKNVNNTRNNVQLLKKLKTHAKRPSRKQLQTPSRVDEVGERCLQRAGSNAEGWWGCKLVQPLQKRTLQDPALQILDVYPKDSYQHGTGIIHPYTFTTIQSSYDLKPCVHHQRKQPRHTVEFLFCLGRMKVFHLQDNRWTGRSPC